MLNSIFKNPGPLFYAILVHIILFAILTVSLDWSSDEETPEEPVNIVKATSVDEKKVQDQLNKLKKAEQDRIKKEQDRQRQLEAEAKKARDQRQAEERKLREIEKKRLQEKRQLEQQKKQLANLEQQKKDKEKKLQDLKKKREAEEKARRVEEQKLAKAREEQKRLEEEKKRRKIEEEKRREAELEKEMERQMKAEEQALMNEKIAEEEARLAAEKANQAQGTVKQYTALIRKSIEDNWRKPLSTKLGVKCTVKVYLIPGGTVRLVEIVKSSGDGFFDSSVDNAVRKAEPLPLPPDPALFDYFRELTFEFESK